VAEREGRHVPPNGPWLLRGEITNELEVTPKGKHSRHHPLNIDLHSVWRKTSDHCDCSKLTNYDDNKTPIGEFAMLDNLQKQ